MSTESLMRSRPNADQMDALISAAKDIAQGISSRSDFEWIALLNGSNYLAVMKKWFQANGCNAMADLSDLCDRWYTLTRTGWTGGVRFQIPAEGATANSDGEKTGDNAGLTCTPSTRTVKGRDDYENLPLFACVDCNVTLDANGKPHISGIAGVGGSFERSNPEKIVGVLQMAGWLRFVSDSDTYGWDYTDVENAAGFQPVSEAVELSDNSVRSWVVHGKYGFGDGWTCCSGQKTLVWSVSHNAQLTGVRSKWGNRYCGATSADDAWLKLMLYLKYGRLDTDRILHGCCNYNYTYTLAAAETGVERILLTPAQAANLIVGSVICVGTSTGRSGSKANDTALLDRVRITLIETVEIGGVSYGAVYVDNGGMTFDTATTYTMYTYQWYTGTTDDVLGNDGGIDPSSDRYPVKIQGIEYMVGCYEVMGDTILTYGNQDGENRCIPNVCRDASKLATSVNSSYQAGHGVPTGASAAWQYPKQMRSSNSLPELIFPYDIGGSTSGGPRDGFYLLIVTSGSYGWLRFGRLYGGVGLAGLSGGAGDHGLGTAYWYFGGRLSVTGNRGEFQAAA